MAFEFPTYDFILTGRTPLLMHQDDVEQADEVQAWQKDPKNKSVSKAGDDRVPAWTWQTYLYHDGEFLVIPQANIMTCLRDAGKKIPGKGRSTFKALTQSGLLIAENYCAFMNNGEPIRIADIIAFRDDPFSAHKKGAQALGFDLMVKRAKIGKAKHVRVRARFDHWTVRGRIEVTDAAITPEVLAQLFDVAGRYIGLCDWRPSSMESPGPHGQFASEVRPVKAARKAG